MSQYTDRWNAAKNKILSILNDSSSFETAKPEIEKLLKTLDFGGDLTDFEFSYNGCGYPWWATHKKIKTDNFKLRQILHEEFDSETFESEYYCPVCMKYDSHKD